MHKLLRLSLFSLLASVCISSNARSVVFSLTSGQKVYYLIDNVRNPIMKFVDGKAVVNADAYEFNDIGSFFISETDDPNAITPPSVGTHHLTENGNMLLIETINASGISILSANGIKMNVPVSQANGYACIDLSQLNQGTYILTTDNHATFKFQKK